MCCASSGSTESMPASDGQSDTRSDADALAQSTSVDEIWSTVSGPPDGPGICIVHGSMDRSTGMMRLARRVDHAARVVRFDRRGYGRSRAHPGPFTLGGNVEDLLAVLDHHLPDRPIHLFGHSYGGDVVLAASRSLGDRVASIVVFEPPLSWMPWWPSGSAKLLTDADGRPTDDTAEAAERFMRRLIGDDRWERLPSRTRTERRAEGRALVEELADLRKHPAFNSGDIAVPVLAMCGSRGADHHRRAARELEAMLPGAKALEVAGARHFGPNTHPDEVAEAWLVHLGVDGLSVGRG